MCTVDLIKEMGKKRDFWAGWLEALPLYIEDKDFIVVHAGKVPNLALKDSPPEWLANIRNWDGDGSDLNRPGDPAWYEFYHQKKLIVFGHWAVRGLVERSNAIGLDSGCVYGKKLSALVLPGREIVQVSAHKAYRTY